MTDPNQPQRRELPVWGWVLIGIGALVLIGAIVGGVVLAKNLVTVMQGSYPGPLQVEIDEDELESPTTEPDISVPPQAEAPRTDGETIWLTESAGSDGFAWGTPYVNGWDIVVMDSDGQNRFSDRQSTCEAWTYQGLDATLRDIGDNDLEVSRQITSLFVGMGLPLDMVGDPVFDPDAPTHTDVPYMFGASDIEMGYNIFTYTDTTGAERTRAFVIRGFIDAGMVLYAEVDCAAEDWSGEFIDELTIMPSLMQ